MSKVGKNNPPQGTGQNNGIDQNKTIYDTGTNTVELEPKNGETLQSPTPQTPRKILDSKDLKKLTKDPQSEGLSPSGNTASKPNDSTTNNNTEDAHIGQDHTQNANLNASAEGINDLLSPQINTLDLNSPQSTQEVNNISNSVTLIKDEKYGGFRVLVEGMSIPFETQDAAEKFKNEYEKLEKECGKLISKNEEQAERLKALGSSMENFNSISIMRLGGYINMAIGFATGNEKLFEEKSADEKQFWDYQTPDEVKITAIEYLKELQSAVEPVINHLEVKLLSDGLLSSNEPLESKLENEIFNNDHSTFKKGILDKIKEFFSWLFHIKSFIQKRDNEIKKLKSEVLDHIQYQTFDRDKTFTMKNNSELIKILDEALKNTRYVNEKTAKAAIENFCSEIGKISSSDSFLLSKDIEKLADLSLDPKYQILCRERAIGANDSGDSTDRCIIRLSTLDQVFAQLLRDSDNNFTIKSLYAAEQKFGKDVLDKIVRAACMNEGLKSRVSETYRNYYTTYHKDYAESHKGEDCPKLRCVDNELHKLLSKFKYLESIKPEEPKKPTKPEEPKDTNQPNYQSLRDEYKKKLQEYSKQHQEYMKKKEDYDKYQAALEEVKNQLEEYKRDKKNWEIDKKTHTWQLISGNITVMSNVEVEDSDEDPVPSIKLWNIPYFVDTKLENS